MHSELSINLYGSGSSLATEAGKYFYAVKGMGVCDLHDLAGVT